MGGWPNCRPTNSTCTLNASECLNQPEMSNNKASAVFILGGGGVSWDPPPSLKC